MGKIATFCRMAMKPGVYPFVWRIARSRLTGAGRSLEDSSQAAEHWCQAQSVSRQRAAEMLLGRAAFDSIRDLFPKETAYAQRVQDQSAVRMGGAGDVDLLYSLAIHLRASRIVETGVAFGWSSLALLLALSKIEDGRLISTNVHYRELGGEEEFVGCIVPEPLRGRWTILRHADRTALPEAISLLAPLDLCHYDSDKSYAGRIGAYSLMWNSLRVGGCLVSDDIADNLAFAHFSRMARTKPVVFSCKSTHRTKFVGVLTKAVDRPLREMLF